MQINVNISSLFANKQLQNTEQKLFKTSEQLSSGLKINHAKDDATGLSMAKKINAQLVSLNQASTNVVNGISIVQTVDGVLGEMTDMIHRLNELAVKASNGVLNDSDRNILCDEVSQILKELQSRSETTEFNGKKLLDGTFDLKGYTNKSDVKVKYYSDDVRTGIYNLDFSNILDSTGNINLEEIRKAFPEASDAKIKNNELLLNGTNGFSLACKFENIPDDLEKRQEYFRNIGKTEINITGFGAMEIQTGSNFGESVGIRIPNMSLNYLGLSDINLSNKEMAENSIEKIKGALNYITKARSGIGAYQNRLERCEIGINEELENLTSTYSKIMDADIAVTMSDYSNLQVLRQANVSVLKQINDSSAIALQLLQ